jgi:hypothetical protein
MISSGDMSKCQKLWVNTLKDKPKETVEISIGDARLQQVLCTSGDGPVEDMMDVDEEVDDASLMSSRKRHIY